MKRILSLGTALLCATSFADAAKFYYAQILAGGNCPSNSSCNSAGNVNGSVATATFNHPNGVTVDPTGKIIYVADKGNNLIRQITGGQVTTIAGSGTAGYADGQGVAAQFNQPLSLTLDSSGNLYVVDGSNYVIRMITPQGNVTTLAGNPGKSGYVNGTGTAASFTVPIGMDIDLKNNLYVADLSWNVIRQVTTANGGSTGGVVTTPFPNTAFSWPNSVGIDQAGNYYIADTNHHAIKTIMISSANSSQQVGALLAGSSTGASGYADGTGSTALFNHPQDVKVDKFGNIFVADTNNNVIRKVTSAGVVTTIAGIQSASTFTMADKCVATQAVLSSPVSLAIDGNTGIIYVAEMNPNRIRQLIPNYIAQGTTDLAATSTDYGQESILFAGGTIKASAAGIVIANPIACQAGGTNSATFDVNGNTLGYTGTVTGNQNTLNVTDSSGSATGVFNIGGDISSFSVVNISNVKVQLTGNCTMSNVNVQNGGSIDLNGFTLTITNAPTNMGTVMDSSAAKTGKLVF